MPALARSIFSPRARCPSFGEVLLGPRLDRPDPTWRSLTLWDGAGRIVQLPGHELRLRIVGYAMSV